jgi:tetratricopeptide (TPR) repeat protein
MAFPEDLLRRVLERAGGSPLYLQLMLAAALESPEPARHLAEVPDTVYGLVQPQVDALSAAERDAAQRAAVLGRQFSDAWLREIVEGTEAAAVIARLEQRGILLEQRPEPSRELSLRDGALQEVLYEGLLQDRRKELHALAAGIVSREATNRPDLAAGAAWHWSCAGDNEHAAVWSLRAGRHAAALYAGQEAIALYGSALDQAVRCSRRDWAAEAEMGLAEVALHRGEFAQALDLFRNAASRLDGVEDTVSELRAVAELGQARVHGRTGSLSDAAPLLESALATLRDLDAPSAQRGWVGALIEQSHVLRDLGQVAEAERAAAAALEAAERRGWRHEAVSAGAALGMAYPRLGDWPSAERVLRTAIAAAERCGDWKGESSCWINLGAGLQGAGRLEEATAAFNRGLHLAMRIGDAEKTAIIRLDLGTVHLNRGEWALAEAAYRAAADEFRRMHHPLGLAAALCNLADALRWGGKVAEATPVLEQTAAALESVDAAFLHAHLLIARAEQLLAQERTGAAPEAAEAALRLARDAEYRSGVNLALLTLGRSLRALADLPAAERVLREALAGCSESGEALEAARAQLELAAVLTAGGKRKEGARLREEGEGTIRKLGALPWLTHVTIAGSPD